MSLPTSGTDGGGPIHRRRAARSVFVFDIDAAGVDTAAALARCDVRLVDRARLPSNGRTPTPRPSAVLVLRSLAPSRLLACLRAVSEGSGAVSPELLCHMLSETLRDAGEGPAAQLTRRELDVLRLLADGASTRDIAERMSYSERTVKNIVRDLLEKLNCRTRAHAVALAARRGMI